MRVKHKENTLRRLVPVGQAMTNCAGVGIQRLPQSRTPILQERRKGGQDARGPRNDLVLVLDLLWWLFYLCSLSVARIFAEKCFRARLIRLLHLPTSLACRLLTPWKPSQLIVTAENGNGISGLGSFFWAV